MSLYDRRFVFFSGKGGVGKSTLAAAFALSCARRGERTLLMELNVKDKMGSIFGAANVGPDISEVEDNLFAVNVNPEAAMEEYGLMILKVRLIYRAVFENRVVRSFLKVIPGLNELLMLGKAYFHAIETTPEGKYVWDKVVVDAPATGHGIFLLQIPTVITSVISSGHMFEEANKILKVLRDPDVTAMNLVTLPEELPVNETLMLLDVTREKLNLPVGYVFANAVYGSLFDDRERAWLDGARAADDDTDDPTRGFLDAARFRSRRIDLQAEYLERLEQQVDVPVIQIPYYFTEKMSFPTVRQIGQDIEAALTGAPPTAAQSVG